MFSCRPSQSHGDVGHPPQLWSGAASADMIHLPDPSQHSPARPGSGPPQGDLALDAGEAGPEGEAQSPDKTEPHAAYPAALPEGGEWGRSPLPFLAQVSSSCPTLCPQIEESEHIKVENSENGSRLTILATRQEHCGCYTLLVENKLGSRQAQVNLTVVGESGNAAAWGSEDRGGRGTQQDGGHWGFISPGPASSAPCPQPRVPPCSPYLPPFSCWASCSWRSPDPAPHPQRFPVLMNPLLPSLFLAFGNPEPLFSTPIPPAPSLSVPPVHALPSPLPLSPCASPRLRVVLPSTALLLRLALGAPPEEDHDPQTQCQTLPVSRWRHQSAQCSHRFSAITYHSAGPGCWLP